MKKILILFFTVSILNYSIAFGKEYSENHWSIRAIEKVNRVKSHGLHLNSDKIFSYKRYKNTSSYITAIYYKGKYDNHYLAVSIIDEYKKILIASQLVSILDEPKSINFDINSYNFISKNIVFGMIVDTELSASIDYFQDKELFLFSYDNSRLKLLINKLQLYTKNGHSDGRCGFSHSKRTIKIANNTYTKEYPKLLFKGVLERGKYTPVMKGELRCIKGTDLKNYGTYKIILEYKDNQYKITNKSIYIDHDVFKNIYQISKSIKLDANKIIKINPGINISKLKIGDEIQIPIDAKLY